MLRPNLVIVCAATLALVLAGCDVNIEATDLSAVTIENDRAVIEKALGKPDEVVEAQGFTVAAYNATRKDLTRRFWDARAKQSRPFDFGDGVVLQVTRPGHSYQVALERQDELDGELECAI